MSSRSAAAEDVIPKFRHEVSGAVVVATLHHRAILQRSDLSISLRIRMARPLRFSAPAFP
jgi:hypothetical protein